MQDNSEEIWKPISITNGKYEVSNFGRVRSMFTDKWYNYSNENKREYKITILKPQNRNGYLRVRLYYDKKWVTKSVHWLVLTEFSSNPNNLPQINHINAIKSDNRLKNLEWIDGIGNVRHALKMGLFKIRFGKDNVTSKEVYQYSLKGDLIKVWESCMSTQKGGFCESTVRACCNGRNNTHAGFVWSFKELNRDYFGDGIIACHTTKRKPVASYGVDGTLLKSYTCSEQTRKDGYNASSVGRCARDGKPYKNLYWKYL